MADLLPLRLVLADPLPAFLHEALRRLLVLVAHPLPVDLLVSLLDLLLVFLRDPLALVLDHPLRSLVGVGGLVGLVLRMPAVLGLHVAESLVGRLVLLVEREGDRVEVL